MHACLIVLHAAGTAHGMLTIGVFMKCSNGPSKAAVPPSDEEGATTGWEGDDEFASGEDTPLAQPGQDPGKRLPSLGAAAPRPALAAEKPAGEHAAPGAAAESEAAAEPAEPAAVAAAGTESVESRPLGGLEEAGSSSHAAAEAHDGDEGAPAHLHLTCRAEAIGVHAPKAAAGAHHDYSEPPNAAAGALAHPATSLDKPPTPPLASPRALHAAPSSSALLPDAELERMEEAAADEEPEQQAAAAAEQAPDQAAAVSHQRTPSDDAESTASTSLREATPGAEAEAGDSGTPASKGVPLNLAESNATFCA